MLKSLAPSRERRNAGVVAIGLLAVVLAGSVYAGSAPVQGAASGVKTATEYQLSMTAEQGTGDGHARHNEKVMLALCMEPGKTGTAALHGWKVEATPTPEGDGRLRIDVAMTVAGKLIVKNRLDAALGESVRTAGKGADGVHDYAIEVTPLAGCPAGVAAKASPVKVTEHLRNASVRSAAESVAAQAGWTLVNPDALGKGLATLSFDNMPAGSALLRLADLAGVQPVFDGKQVRFEPK